MDGRRFDEMTRSLSGPASRRSVIGMIAGGFTALAVGSRRTQRAEAAGICAQRVPNPAHAPSSNGCGTASFPATGIIGAVDVTPACNHHDLCYDTCGRVKHDCDETFNRELRAICDAGNPKDSPARNDCYNATNVYYRAVKFLGTAAFDAAQQAACRCCMADQAACGAVCCPAGRCFGHVCWTRAWSH